MNERMVFKIDRPELSVNEVNVGPAFEGTGPHFHKLHVDAFYVLEGQLEFTLGTETLAAGAGTSVAIPPGIVHAFTNPGPGGARYLNIHAPDSGFAELLRRRNRGEQFDETEHDIYDVDEPGGPADADVVEQGRGERLARPNGVITVRTARPELCCLEFDAEQGWGPVDAHRHERQVDSFYVLEGALDLVVDGSPLRGGPGTFVAVLPGVEHGIAQVEASVRFLNFHAPDEGFAAFVRSK